MKERDYIVNIEENDELSSKQESRQNDGILESNYETTRDKRGDETTDGILPVIIIPNTIFLPHTRMSVNVDKQHTAKILENINEEQHGVILTPKKIEPDENNVEFYDVGTILEIKNMDETAQDYILDIEVKDKVFIKRITEEKNRFYCEYMIMEEINNITPEESKTFNKQINDLVKMISQIIPQSDMYAQQIINKVDIQEKVAEIFPYIKVTIEKKQELLERKSVKIRTLEVIELLAEQKDAMYLQMQIAKKLNEDMSQIQKQTLLREQMKMIQEELGMTDEESKTYRQKVEEADLPEEVRKVAFEEVSKLERQGPNNSEENIIRNYLDTILKLPWHKSDKKEIDINKARKQLDDDHYGLKKVKKRIIQHLTVMKMKDDKQGSILLFVGPPGTGKTSLGKSIATALDRPYIRVSLGGVKDESEIRGHRRTYLGALPGRIISGMKKAGETNPVFILDEIDKLTESINGNPTSALLEVLDPEQNDTFSDHYLEVAYDLSDVFFIATANSLQDIPAPLRDRLEIIELESYTNQEKTHIAREHLIPEVLEEHGLSEDDLIIEDEALNTLIEKYTKEAGVRSLKREIAAIARATTEKIVVDDIDLPYIVKDEMLYDLLGHEKAHYDIVPDKQPAGVVTGLAWTPVGGDILYIEAAMTPGKGRLELTGKLGDVMKESAQIAYTLIKSRLGSIAKEEDFDEVDLHIHVPEGSIPKDGPSAGVTLLTTIASIVTSTPVDSKLAMTGEISLRGKVLPIGGVKEKVIAAQRSGITRILLPEDNMKDLDDVPDEVKNKIEFKAVTSIDEVLYEALSIKLPETELINIDVEKINAE